MKTTRIRRISSTISSAVSMAVYQNSTTSRMLAFGQCVEGQRYRFPRSQTGELVRLFNPRRHVWSDHFVFRGAAIKPLTTEGSATARLVLAAFGRYPR
jgi:hypothetical protein